MRKLENKIAFIFQLFCVILLFVSEQALQTSTTIQEHLVSKARKGDNRSKEELFRLYVTAMYHHAVRITGNQNDAEDVVQDSFIQAFAKLQQLKDDAAFGGWLRQIVVNSAIRFCKKKIRWHDLTEYGEQSDDDAWWIDIPMQKVHDAIKNLSDGCRQVFALYVFENYAHKDIAAELGISESTSKSQYQRARQLLKERLTKSYG